MHRPLRRNSMNFLASIGCMLRLELINHKYSALLF